MLRMCFTVLLKQRDFNRNKSILDGNKLVQCHTVKIEPVLDRIYLK